MDGKIPSRLILERLAKAEVNRAPARHWHSDGRIMEEDIMAANGYGIVVLAGTPTRGGG